MGFADYFKRNDAQAAALRNWPADAA